MGNLEKRTSKPQSGSTIQETVQEKPKEEVVNSQSQTAQNESSLIEEKPKENVQPKH